MFIASFATAHRFNIDKYRRQNSSTAHYEYKDEVSFRTIASMKLPEPTKGASASTNKAPKRKSTTTKYCPGDPAFDTDCAFCPARASPIADNKKVPFESLGISLVALNYRTPRCAYPGCDFVH